MGNGSCPNEIVKSVIFVSYTSFALHSIAMKRLADGSEAQNPVQ